MVGVVPYEEAEESLGVVDEKYREVCNRDWVVEGVVEGQSLVVREEKTVGRPCLVAGLWGAL